MYSAYGVVEDTGYKDRLYLGHFESELAARESVRRGIAGGCLFGYVMRGHDVIVYLTAGSPRVRGLVEKASAEDPVQRGEPASLAIRSFRVE